LNLWKTPYFAGVGDEDWFWLSHRRLIDWSNARCYPDKRSALANQFSVLGATETRAVEQWT
jgi:hypothetical protein